MQALTALAPLVAFFATYRLRGLYAATAVLMAAMVLVLALDWLRHRRIPALHERLRAGSAQWQRLNLSSGVLYALLGALNLVVAYNASERAWVNFKMFGLTLLTFAGITLQLLWLARARIAARPGAGEHG